MYLRFQLESFGLFAALRSTPRELKGPVVLVDAGGRVAELNSAAQARQLIPGMTMAQALGRCSGLEVVHADPAAVQAAERILWNAAWQITPQIELRSGGQAGVATLELVRPELGQVNAQALRALQQLRRCGLPARAGLAATPDWAGFAALTAERFQLKILPSAERARELLRHLPLTVMEGLSARHCQVLEGWGIRSLGALADLPRQSLGERLGAAGLNAWDVLNGTQRRVLQFSELAPDFSQNFDLESPVSDLEALCFLVHRAAEALELQLTQEGKAARAVSIELRLENTTVHQKTIRLPEATSRAALLERLLRNYLEPLRLQAGVCALRLTVDPVDPLSRQAGLFERSVRNPWRLQETLDQLAGLIGSECFGSPRCVDTHRPDSYRLVPLPVDAEALEAGASQTEQGPPQMGPPLRRFRPPLAAKVRLREEQPVWVESAAASGEVQSANGPYRLSGDWAEAKPWAQLEWDVEICGAGVYCLGRSGLDWRVVGAYD